MLFSQAMRKLGPEVYQQVYDYLKEQRKSNAEKEHDENKIFSGLKQFTSNTTDCFLVDQLLFLEES
jgi:NIMA (never in mitosis gene a)-related kinase